MSSGTITLRRPRVRGVEERFESRVLPLFARRTKELGALLPQLYLHGLAEGDFELAMRGLLGEGAPLSKSSIRRPRAGWTAEFEEWSQRRLEGREVVYVWADGIYVKAGLERDKAALLVVLGAMRDGTKEVLALRSGYRESVESCSEVLRDLKARGIEAPRLQLPDRREFQRGRRSQQPLQQFPRRDRDALVTGHALPTPVADQLSRWNDVPTSRIQLLRSCWSRYRHCDNEQGPTGRPVGPSPLTRSPPRRRSPRSGSPRPRPAPQSA